MQTLNLTNVKKSDIKYTISHFPDGEVQITLGEFSRKDTVEVHCRITNPEMFSENNSPILVVDDLCDGGGTFVGIAQKIRKYCPDRELNIFVTHMVNHKGIENLSKNFDHVYFTNFYYNWESGYKVNGMKFPENITQINII